LDIKDPYYEPLLAYLKASNTESERGKVLVAAAQIDEMLGEVLRAKLLENAATYALFDGPNAPFQSFFNKINACRALGLISEDEFHACNGLRRLRNEMAHSVSASLDDPQLSDRVLSMRFGVSKLVEVEDPVMRDPRVRFGMIAVSVISSLYNRAHYVARERSQEFDWKVE